MKNIYENTSVLDSRVIDEFKLSEEILVENASSSMEVLIDKVSSKNSLIIIVVGANNNGADGLALARRLHRKYNVKVFMQHEPKSNLCKMQYDRAKSVGVVFIKKLFLCDIVVDCLFGSGLNRELDSSTLELIEQMNKIARINIACDMPSGVFNSGKVSKTTFVARYTIAMGALKLAYFSDIAKDYVGEVRVGNLGISNDIYETSSSYKLLEREDCKLPIRKFCNVHKGDFGHCCVIAGEKQGASIISALSAYAFGAGLVSIIGDVSNVPYHIMNTMSLPKNCNAIAFGMGLGNKIKQYEFDFLGKIPSVLDADIFYVDEIKSMIQKGNVVLTPHPKEFASLLKILQIGEYDVEYVINHRVELCLKFSSLYSDVVLVLKGANTIIAYDNMLYFNTFGCNKLSKGGSGDVLSGMIASLLAQGYERIQAAISASLAHAMASNDIESGYGLEPIDLINKIKILEPSRF